MSMEPLETAIQVLEGEIKMREARLEREKNYVLEWEKRLNESRENVHQLELHIPRFKADLEKLKAGR